MASWVPWTRAWRIRRDRAICRQTIERVQEIVDGELPHGHAARVIERHLAACRRCGEEAAAVRALKEAIARVACQCDPESVARLEDLARRLCSGEQISD